MIREATEADLPIIVSMSDKFVSEAWGKLGIEAEKDSLMTTCLNLIEHPDGLLLVSEENGVVSGVIAGVVYGWHFARSTLTAQELVWYAPQCREAIGLKSAYERWAISKGATTIHMAAIDGARYLALARLYRRMGYLPSEHIYIKVVPWSELPEQS